MVSSVQLNLTGRSLGPYRILEEVGAGGMGTVYRAEVTGRVAGLSPGDIVALKIIHPHLLKMQGFFKRFLREGEVGKKIRHPNVVATLDLDGLSVGDETVLYLAMEYAKGQTLWSLYQELGTLPEDLGRHLAREIAQGLDAIHQQGVVHRDLKPENILVTADHQVKVMDLGVARMADECQRLSATGTFIGSALYAAPEQFDDLGTGIDHRVDLFALGLLLYELTTGSHPFEAVDVPRIVKRVLTETPKRMSELTPQVSPFFEEVVHTLLAKNRDERFATAAELIEVLAEGEKSAWWKSRARQIRARTKKPLRRVRVVRETDLFGRESEIARLRAAYEKAKSGIGQVVLIEGEAGIGKSRLVDEFAAALQESGEPVNFLFGGFPPGGAATVASPVISACRNFFGDEDPTDALREYLNESSSVIPTFAALLRGDNSATAGGRLGPESLQTVFIQLLAALAMHRPTILLIDDLHFAPQPGLSLFAALALAIAGRRVLLVGTTRPGLPEDWSVSVSRMGHAQRVTVPRLGLKDVARLLIAAVGSSQLADEIGFQIVQRSDGNPFFIFEILRSLREGQVLAQGADGKWHATKVIRDIRIPSSLQEIIKARIAALEDEERDVLEVAACCGFEFDPRLVGDAMGIDRVTVLKRLARIERGHRIVHPFGDRFVFDHHELHEALRAGLPDSLRGEYHAALAAALEAREGVADIDPEKVDGTKAAELANLFLSAGEGPRALRYLRPALAHLDGSYHGDVAAALVDRALALPRMLTGGDRVDVLLRQAERLELLGRNPAEREIVEEALELTEQAPDPGLRVRALAAAARCHRHAAEYNSAMSRLEEALQLASGGDQKKADALAHGVLGQILCETGRYDEALGAHEREASLSREIGDALGEAAAFGRLSVVCRELGRFDDAYAHVRSEVLLIRKSRDRLGRAHTKLHLGAVMFALGRYEDAATHFARALTLSRLVGYRRGEAEATMRQGEVMLAMGDIDAARKHFEAATSVCRETGLRYLLGRALHGLAAACAAQAEQRTAFEHAKAALGLRREIGDRAGTALSLILLGRLRRTAGAADAARSAFTEALEIGWEIRRADARVLSAAYLSLLEGDPATAAEILVNEEKRLEIGDRIEARCLLWQATRSDEHLAEAQQLVDHVLAHVPPERRDATAGRMPLPRTVST